MTRNKNQDEVYDKGSTSSIAVAELPDSDLDSVNGGCNGNGNGNANGNANAVMRGRMAVIQHFNGNQNANGRGCSHQ